MNYYTVYRDEEVVAFGTAIQCAKILNLKNVRQFYALVSKSRSGLRRHYSVVVETINNQEELVSE